MRLSDGERQIPFPETRHQHVQVAVIVIITARYAFKKWLRHSGIDFRELTHCKMIGMKQRRPKILAAAALSAMAT